MKKMLFIYNANAGRGRIKAVLSDVIEIFCRADFDVTIHATRASKEATEIVTARGSEFDVVVCSGGDGTINEVVSGLITLPKKPLCGYFPMGTVNDFANSLGIPCNPITAAKVITSGQPFACDIGSFNERYFNYVAAFGAFTEVAYETPQKNKNSMGRMAYFLDAFRLLPDIKGYHMRVEADGREIEGEYIFGMITNSKSVGGIQLTDRDNGSVALNDGVFEVVLIRNPNNIIELEETLTAVRKRKIDAPYIDVVQAAEITLISDENVKWTLDGENGGSLKKVKIKCNPKAVDIIVPDITAQ